MSVTIVVMRGPASPAVLRRARSANSCSLAEAREIENAVGVGASGPKSSSDHAVPGKGKRANVIDLVVGAVKGVTKKARIEGNPFSDPILFIVGLLTLSSACLGGFVLLRGSRMTRWSRLLR